MPGTVIHWFRKGLRLHDNPALNKALAVLKNGEVFKAIYILNLTNSQQNQMVCGANRWRFLLESLDDLNRELCEQLGCPLYVIRGEPKSIFEDLIDKWNIKTITYESDIEPYYKECSRIVNELAKTHKIEIFSDYYHTLYPSELIVRKNNNKVPLTYRQLEAAIGKIGKPKLPIKLVSKTKFNMDSYKDYDTKYFVPDFKEIGLDTLPTSPSKYPGGETEALKRLDHFIRSDPKWIQTFEKPNTSPNSIEPSTTVLSPYVTFGCLSVRLFYARIDEILSGSKKHSKPPVSLIGQLFWREFYYVAGANVRNFDRMHGNEICLQVPWRDDYNQMLEAWAYGRTGYPFIDAIMRQLRTEGWIHHLARHAVACFLTRGDLWISWEQGQKVFEELLLDADWALNAGNWLWLSASAFFHQYFRVYSPVSFGRKTDPTGAFIRKYCPELRNYSDEFIFEPWKASKSIQKQADCIIGDKYPNRIVIHEKVMKINMERMTKAYRAAKNKPDNSTTGPASKQTKTK